MNRERSKLFYEEFDDASKRPVIVCDPLILGDTYLGHKRLLLNDISFIPPLLLTMGTDGELEYIKTKKGGDGIRTKINIRKNQLITYYEGKIINYEAKQRYFVSDYGYDIDYTEQNEKVTPQMEGIGYAKFVRGIKHLETAYEKANVEMIILDTDFNYMNMEELRYIDHITIDDIKQHGLIRNGLRIEDRLILLKSKRDIKQGEELIINENNVDHWNRKILGYEKRSKKNEKALRTWLSERYSRDVLDIEKLKIDDNLFKNKLMFLNEFSNLKDIFFTLGNELEYKKSNIPNAGNGVFTRVDIKKNQLITFYQGKIYEKEEAEDLIKEREERLKKTSTELNSYTIELMDNYVIIGDLDEQGNPLDLSDPNNVNNMGGGGFINDDFNNKYGGNNTRFELLTTDYFRINDIMLEFNEQWGLYIDKRYIDNFINNKYYEQERPTDGIIVIKAIKDIKANQELLVSYGKKKDPNYYWTVREMIIDK